VEDPALPVEVYVDGAFIPRDDWIFLPGHETVAIRLVATGQPTPVPPGTPVAIYYADHEDDRHHKHIRDRFVTADGQFSFELSEAHDSRFPVYPMMDGFIQANPDNYGYAGQQSFFHITPPASDGVIVEIRGARLEYLYKADVDFDVQAYMFKEDEVPPARIVWAQSLKNGIDSGVALPVQSGSEVLETGFIVEPDISTPAGFVLKSSALYEDAWFFEADTDERSAWSNFGSVIGFDRATSNDYVRVVQALFAAYFKGSQRYTLENFACLIMGASFLDAPATLQRVQESRDRRDAQVLTLDQQSLTYELSKVVPDRLVRGSTMPKFHALTQYCKIMDLTAQNFPWLAVAAASFSEDFAFAKNFDYATPGVITGVDPLYDVSALQFTDTTKDFVDGEAGTVWPGDLVAVEWSGGQRGYGRVEEVVDKSILKVRLSVPEILSAYGKEAYGGGPPGKVHAYGGSRAQEYIERYTIWVRQIRRLDSYHFMDSMTADELSYVNGVIVPLLSPFVFLIRFHWEGLNEGLLEDVKHFLDTAKPAASNYIAFSNVNEDAGIVDTAGVELVEEPLDIDIIPNLFAVGLGAIDGGDPVGSSIEVA
jgi:hypothetical protein